MEKDVTKNTAIRQLMLWKQPKEHSSKSEEEIAYPVLYLHVPYHVAR